MYILVPFSCHELPSQLLQSIQQGRRVGADNVPNLVTVLEEQESGHSAHSQVLAQLGELVDINLDEVDAVLELGVIGCSAREVSAILSLQASIQG